MVRSQYKHKPISVPPALQALPDAPKELYALGNNLLELLKRPRVAIVGSRKMSAYGKQVTEGLAGKLAGRGVVIVSGLAYGVDITAHQAALAAGGQCIAVQANGLDRLYPVAHSGVGQQIVDSGGVIISEYPAGTRPLKPYFLERNRLVAGLADVVIITEAAARSGTLNTAAHALNQGTTVFAVPGNITSPLSEGTNNLLKSGAIPLGGVDDLWSHLEMDTQQPVVLPAANPEEFVILSLVQKGIYSGETLLKESGLSVALFNQTLTMLEITAKIRPLGGNQWALA